ncbi:hypothetical protein Y1Q_0000438 [Alligator mississippiensis]|uniref:Uncharacterized protein n=1 Tax=Alligator mississippiensis TaxID=8496 RepID=A0A151MB17_ALLMI|nr:hypothetical protein Y1Q_0000438 [Alligator mississippiensis]
MVATKAARACVQSTRCPHLQSPSPAGPDLKQLLAGASQKCWEKAETAKSRTFACTSKPHLDGGQRTKKEDMSGKT